MLCFLPLSFRIWLRQSILHWARHCFCIALLSEGEEEIDSVVMWKIGVLLTGWSGFETGCNLRMAHNSFSVSFRGCFRPVCHADSARSGQHSFWATPKSKGSPREAAGRAVPETAFWADGIFQLIGWVWQHGNFVLQPTSWPEPASVPAWEGEEFMYHPVFTSSEAKLSAIVPEISASHCFQG